VIPPTDAHATAAAERGQRKLPTYGQMNPTCPTALDGVGSIHHAIVAVNGPEAPNL
jgi:hypothetical protein